MDRINEILAHNITKYRKRSGLSQVALAEKIGVSFQVVSKWETAKCAPDIALLPMMADLFGCHIDELFSREVKTEIHFDHCAEFPWPDDNVVRVFQTIGKKIIKKQEGNNSIDVFFPRDCNETTKQYFKVEVFGNIVSDGCINGDVVCHGRIDCHEINGDITASGDVSAYQINSCVKMSCNEFIKKK